METEIVEAIATCHAEGCMNSELQIPVPVDRAGPLVFCGGCMGVIEDVVIPE